jgi:hypothetical protein
MKLKIITEEFHRDEYSHAERGIALHKLIELYLVDGAELHQVLVTKNQMYWMYMIILKLPGA